MKPTDDKNSRKHLFAENINTEAIDLAIVWPDSQEALGGAIEAAEQGVIKPLFIGDVAKMKNVAAQLQYDISLFSCIETNEEDATKIAIQLVKEKKAQAIMKGSLYTHKFLMDILSHKSGLHTGRLISHCMFVDSPNYKKPLIISDAALNINPTISQKKDIIQNAIQFAQKLAIEVPKVALLSTTETISEKIITTVEWAILCQMAKRGQIKGGLIDGPLSCDVALSEEAAAIKHLSSAVAGDPDILIVPNIDAGNILFKTIGYLANAKTYGILIGTTIPIIITSRSASIEERVDSCYLARFHLQQK